MNKLPINRLHLIPASAQDTGVREVSLEAPVSAHNSRTAFNRFQHSARAQRTTDSRLPVVAKPTAPMAEPARIEIGACLVCKGMGWLRYDVEPGHSLFGKLKKCQCLEVEAVRRGCSLTYTWLGLPEDRQGAMLFESFTRRDFPWQQRAFDLASGYASMLAAQVSGQPNVLFKGKVGTGKTHLACAILNRLRANGIACLFATAPELFTALYAADFDKQARLIDMCANTPVFCLDDIDKLHTKPSNDPDIPAGTYQKSILFDILNRRYRAKRSTIITTNAQAGLDRWLDEATQDRLFGVALHIEMMGESQRRARQERSK